jgi:hypothetical protein
MKTVLLVSRPRQLAMQAHGKIKGGFKTHIEEFNRKNDRRRGTLPIKQSIYLLMRYLNAMGLSGHLWNQTAPSNFF